MLPIGSKYLQKADICSPKQNCIPDRRPFHLEAAFSPASYHHALRSNAIIYYAKVLFESFDILGYLNAGSIEILYYVYIGIGISQGLFFNRQGFSSLLHLMHDKFFVFSVISVVTITRRHNITNQNAVGQRHCDRD